MTQTETHQALEILERGESLCVEFKSDRKCLSDRDLVAAVVALANTEGGDLFLGVEDDGTVTGLHDNHVNLTGLASLVANRTNPALTVGVQAYEYLGHSFARIAVQKSRHLVATSDGQLLRRRLKADGTPEAVPFYPHEFVQRQSGLGLVDPSAMALTEVTVDELDPLQRLRIRKAIERYVGDQSLLALADDELDGALGLMTTSNGLRCPTVAGLLFLGSERLLRQHLPAHEVAFQVLRGTDVLANTFFRKPLLETFEEVELLFRARVSEEEIQVGLFRVPVPNFDQRAFREAFVNALVHRDYSTLGTVHVRIDSDGLALSSPGGFVEGVNLDNLLVVDPRSRNPLLADIIKRIGLAERTGRGIDRIYEGMLRYGRPAPDYAMSGAHAVSLRMVSGDADLAFLRMVLEREAQIGGALPLDSLIILTQLREARRLATSDFATATQKPENLVRSSLEKLVEAGLIEAHGANRGRTYTLSAGVYRGAGQGAAYVRQAGFDPIQQEQMVLNFIDTHGVVKRSDVMDLCHLSKDQAYKILTRLRDRGEIVKIGENKGAVYERRR